MFYNYRENIRLNNDIDINDIDINDIDINNIDIDIDIDIDNDNIDSNSIDSEMFVTISISLNHFRVKNSMTIRNIKNLKNNNLCKEHGFNNL